jgi:hypothetical protein
MKVQCVTIVYLLALGSAHALHGAQLVSPIAKVITLLEDLKTSVEDEAKEEAKTYDKFACFCKDNTEEKSTAITEGQTTIDSDSATIGEKTAALAEKQTELMGLKKQIQTITLEIAEAEAQRAKEKAEYEMVIADLEKALSSMEKAIEALEASKPADLFQVRKIIRRSVALADVLELNPKHRRAIAAFLQAENTEDPESEYEFHSQGIIDILKDLKEDFTKNKEEKDTEEEKASKAHDALMAEKKKMVEDAKAAKSEAEDAIANLQDEIATTKESLVEAEAELKDNQLYLKDLTARCELKAKEWDQRSQMRADEVQAITQALEVIKGGAAENEADRAMLQEEYAASSSSGSEGKEISDHRALDIAEDDVGDLGLDFLQEQGTMKAHALRFLNKAKADIAIATSDDARKQKALDTLVKEGRRIGSSLLLSTAINLGPDPFKKVKQLIQALVERLLQEMASEAGHKGFCDTELGKAKTNRNFEHERTQKYSAKLQKLEVAEATLEESIVTLTGELEDLNQALEKAAKLRDEEKEDNTETINKSKEGLEAIKEAITILKEFYKNAAKALLQIKASPIDEKGENPGELPGGSYKGQQKKAEGIIGMLEVIKSDFERSVKQTTDAEDESHRSFVSFDRESKGSISTKETAKLQAESDLKETKIEIKETMANLEESQKLLDDAVKAIEELKPTCIDTGMSYEERVAKREEEIEALKTALCQLDVEGVEETC